MPPVSVIFLFCLRAFCPPDRSAWGHSSRDCGTAPASSASSRRSSTGHPAHRSKTVRTICLCTRPSQSRYIRSFGTQVREMGLPQPQRTSSVGRSTLVRPKRVFPQLGQ